MDPRTAAYVIASAHPHGLHQIRLLKLLWLAELKHYERTGERLTNANWFRWENGPYSKDVVNAVKGDKAIFTLEWEATTGGNNGLVIQTRAPLAAQVKEAELETLKDILWTYEQFTNKELLMDVYGDKFFEETPYSYDFDFSKLPGRRGLRLREQDEKEILALPTRPFEDLGELFD